MLTKERMEEIGELVDNWNAKEEYPTSIPTLGHFEAGYGYDTSEECKLLVDRAANDMGLSVAELREYFKQSAQEFMS